jgi:hypothetical protein
MIIELRKMQGITLRESQDVFGMAADALGKLTEENTRMRTLIAREVPELRENNRRLAESLKWAMSQIRCNLQAKEDKAEFEKAKELARPQEIMVATRIPNLVSIAELKDENARLREALDRALSWVPYSYRRHWPDEVTRAYDQAKALTKPT